MTSPPAREGAHAQLLHALGGAIAAGRLEPGAVLTLARLGRDYGVSRTTAREACLLYTSDAADDGCLL
ncbi:GntR family transcriptional regulator [Frigoribacterium faeni]|uniref:GntR family transcriptional regulator n=1 Tax=Frigoribacterium faeni TaxID=145483 RepID=UPI001FAD124A|nr:GntR family transcriptional regulator [Frigoribacterium faeni]MCJ0699837.1 GntR family transcriptional regulator [Frigoribacterium faeni]